MGVSEEVTMRRIELVGVLAVLSWLGGASVVRAGDPACLAAGREAFQACRSQCKDDLVTTRFACRGVQPACGKACLAGREVCGDAVAQPLVDCVAACKATLQTDKGACPPNDDVCINAAQVKAFVCRDTCRDTWRADPNTVDGLANCKNIFRACVRQCPTA